MTVNKRLCFVLLTLLVVLTLAGVSPRPGFAAEAGRDLPPVNADLYALDPVALQPVDCGQCHVGQFGDLKQAGGKHRFDCQECHQIFHAYNPRKNNYDDLMPECATCHGQQHGPKQADCISCHRNPHAPLKIPALDRLANACSDCHASPTAELKKFPSAHTVQGCQSCHHERHGYIPDCFECHDGHFDGQSVESCAECHRKVHAPLNISFAADADSRSCSTCHVSVYGRWQGTSSKHGEVLCSMCHQEHGKIPDCQECHGEPHEKGRMEMFPNCLTCHIDVHDLPVKKKK